MRELLAVLKQNNLEAVADKARRGKATANERDLLKGVAGQIDNQIEARLIQIESLAKAVQVACIDADGSGIYDHQTDGFNFAYWLQEEAQTLQALTVMQSDYDYLSSKDTATKGAA